MTLKFKNIINWSLVILISIFLSGCTNPNIAVQHQIEIISEPEIHYFNADIYRIKPGQPVTLSWYITNADIAEITPNIGRVGLSDTRTIFPEESIIYTLKAINKIGEKYTSISITLIKENENQNCKQVKCDIVSGRNQDIILNLEQLCLCSIYQIQIAQDPEFSQILLNETYYTPHNLTSPGYIYLAGGLLNCGKIYYVRVRCTSTVNGQNITSPWSLLDCINIETGFPVSKPRYD